MMEANKIAEQGWSEAWDDMTESVDAARVLLMAGRSRAEADGQIYDWLRANEVSQVVARDLVDGRYMTYADYRWRRARRSGVEE
jgi:hypothetical protein